MAGDDALMRMINNRDQCEMSFFDLRDDFTGNQDEMHKEVAAVKFALRRSPFQAIEVDLQLMQGFLHQ